jgi:EAL domain-containing protein (putative c-di-GMP-specific phosphodiesterase class I)/GGDEF domain-containing protein
MNSTLPATDSALRGRAQGRAGRILLIGALAVLLQQIAAPYTASLSGVTALASLLHLQTGLLLAVAMLERDRWVLAGACFIVYLGWMARAIAAGYDMALWMPFGTLSHLLGFGWLLLCAHWMGWPKPRGQVRVGKGDLARFATIALLLFPCGMAAITLLGGWLWNDPDMFSGAIQIVFAKYFGVAVLTLPLVFAWSERGATRTEELRRRDWLWPATLGLALLVAYAAGTWIRAGFDDVVSERVVVMMDYRFALFALLGWCALRLRPHWSMLLLALTMFALVLALDGAAERNGTPLGFVNLAHLAFELGVLLMAILYFVVFERDARELAAALEQETRRDTATGLPNLAAMRHDIARTPTLAASGAVGFLLLDRTDDLVAGFGLDIQTRVAAAVAACLAETDRLYLLGMGQFALLSAGEDAGAGHWEHVIAAVEAIEVDTDGQRFRLSPYLGVAHWTEASPAAVEAALLLASELAFEARRRSEVRPLHDDDVASPQSGVLRQRLHATADALTHLRNQRIELHFQPIRRLDPTHPDHDEPDYAFGEVLCRLRDADGKLLHPHTFLGPIEAAGRTIELDLAVMKALFETLRQHPLALPRIRRIAVNLTGQSLASLSFRRQFEALLADSPLPLSSLCFEITENAVITSEVHTRSFLDDLHGRGCRIAIDDFGTGTQSFARLKEVPVDIIKIDGSFVRHVTEGGRDHALVEASVAIARAFNAATVAEYVETEATAECLRGLGLHWMQGFLYAEPRPLAEMLAEEA